MDVHRYRLPYVFRTWLCDGIRTSKSKFCFFLFSARFYFIFYFLILPLGTSIGPSNNESLRCSSSAGEIRCNTPSILYEKNEILSGKIENEKTARTKGTRGSREVSNRFGTSSCSLFSYSRTRYIHTAHPTAAAATQRKTEHAVRSVGSLPKVAPPPTYAGAPPHLSAFLSILRTRAGHAALFCL